MYNSKLQNLQFKHFIDNIAIDLNFLEILQAQRI